MSVWMLLFMDLVISSEVLTSWDLVRVLLPESVLVPGKLLVVVNVLHNNVLYPYMLSKTYNEISLIL